MSEMAKLVLYERHYRGRVSLIPGATTVRTYQVLVCYIAATVVFQHGRDCVTFAIGRAGILE